MADLFISPTSLIHLLGVPGAPMVLDVRTSEDIAADPTLLPTAVPVALDDMGGVTTGPEAVVYCQKGGKISQIAASILRQRGVQARVLTGGHLAWIAEGRPVADINLRNARWIMPLDPDPAQLVALWLLRRWIEPQAQVHAVARDQVPAAASVWQARVVPSTAAELAAIAGLSGVPMPDPRDLPPRLLAGRLSRVSDPALALDLIDDLAFANGVAA